MSLNPSFLNYSYTILPENTQTIRPKLDKGLIHQSYAYTVIKEAKAVDRLGLKQSIRDNREALVASTIEHGLSKKIPFADCVKPLNINPEDPAFGDQENRYSSYERRLSATPIKKLIAKTFSAKKINENASPRKSPPPHVLKDYKRRVKPLALIPSNKPLSKIDWANHINKGLDPASVDSNFFQTVGFKIQDYYREVFHSADLTELAAFQRVCGIPIDLLELEQLLAGEKPKKIADINRHAGFRALLQAYLTLFLHARDHHLSLPRPRLRLEDEFVYLNFTLGRNRPAVDPQLPLFKSITHQLKDEYERDLTQEMKIIRQLVSLDFSRAIDQLSDEATLERQYEQLHTLLKEQKKHTFMRFLQLPYFYSSFCNTAHAIAKHLSKGDPDRGDRYMAMMQELITFQSLPSDLTDQGYRSPHFMDLRPNPKEAFERYINEVNLSLKEASNSEQPIVLIERAHTLPFPGAFSWGREKILSLLQPEEMLSEDETMVKEIFCPAELYFGLKNRTLSQQEFEVQVIEHFEQKTLELNSSPTILHYALLFTHIFYLRLHSETELLPDLVNHQLDNLSEWVGAPFKISYKEALGACLVELLQETQAQNGINQDAVVNVLNTRYTGPILVRTREALERHQKNTPLDRFMRIAIAQIHQSLLQILSDPDEIQEVKQLWASRPAPMTSIRV